MSYTIAQIGRNRLEKVLNSGRDQDIKKLLNLLKSDIKTVLESYAVVIGDVAYGIYVRIKALCWQFCVRKTILPTFLVQDL